MNDLTSITLALLLGGGVVLWFLRPTTKSTPAETAGRPGGREGAAAIPGPATEIVENMSVGVLVLNDNLRPRFANQAARTLLGLQPGTLPVRLPSLETAQVAERAIQDAEQAEELIEIFYPERRNLRVQSAPLEDGGAMVCLLDVTEEARTQRIRREFVAHASHELKSPVAGVQALAEALSQAIPDDPETALRFAGRIMDETERLGKLISDLLDLSRLEDPARAPEDPCDLASVARRELAHIERAAHNNDLTLSSEIEPQLWIKGDAQQLSLLLRNLLDNAVQYTNPGGNIRLEVSGEGDEAVVRVTDDGAGIPLEAQTRVFERFYRVDRARSRDRGGTGLGLAIVKHVAELHGGTVDVQSELGAGSSFTTRIPAIPKHQVASPPLATEKETA
jgi:signal transduction histidine kinase